MTYSHKKEQALKIIKSLSKKTSPPFLFQPNTHVTFTDKSNLDRSYQKGIDSLHKYTEYKRIEINVDINIPQHYISDFQLSNTLESIDEFLDVTGFEYKSKQKPVIGSYFQRLLFWTKKPSTQAEISNIFNKGKASLQANYLNKPAAESTNLLADAAAKLMTAAASLDEVVLRLGALVLVKAQIDGKAKVFIETVSPEITNYLDENPGMLRDPELVYHFLSQLPLRLKTKSNSLVSNTEEYLFRNSLEEGKTDID